MPLEIVRNDITKMDVDAIVNAANSMLRKGGGVCGAIFDAAGEEKMEAALKKYKGCKAGEAVITKGFDLPAKYVIHTVGPVWQGGTNGEEDVLKACYRNSLQLAKDKGLESIAFPLLSSGAFGYPKDKALQAAISSIGEFLMESDMTVYLVVFDKKAFSLSGRLFREVRAYITDSYAERAREGTTTIGRYLEMDFELRQTSEAVLEKSTAGIEDIVNNLDTSFSETLIKLIDMKGLIDPEVYKKANIDRRHFSKIKNNPGYRPSKNTALALCIALQLNLDQTTDLLRRAGLALSPSSRFDLIVEYFIKKGIYDIYEINSTLFYFDENTLGG
ncbi:macro domain-containing protein [Gudongella oleilytica]|jgi:O-acetyl-ADP-ribose deacetylase (regulator of RNase III)|uniref:macro domain-containing protein n=1 Tax=Gudongella oleilytica TaxID=1582259 RepID=UPI000FF88AA8|nr:macro domain-containing protein [Gudongella oleilytica]